MASGEREQEGPPGVAASQEAGVVPQPAALKPAGASAGEHQTLFGEGHSEHAGTLNATEPAAETAGLKEAEQATKAGQGKPNADHHHNLEWKAPADTPVGDAPEPNEGVNLRDVGAVAADELKSGIFYRSSEIMRWGLLDAGLGRDNV